MMRIVARGPARLVGVVTAATLASAGLWLAASGSGDSRPEQADVPSAPSVTRAPALPSATRPTADAGAVAFCDLAIHDRGCRGHVHSHASAEPDAGRCRRNGQPGSALSDADSNLAICSGPPEVHRPRRAEAGGGGALAIWADVPGMRRPSARNREMAVRGTPVLHGRGAMDGGDARFRGPGDLR